MRIFRFIFVLTVVFADVASAGRTEVIARGGGGAREIHQPFSVAFDSEGRLYGVEFLRGNRVFTLDEKGRPEFIAGVFHQTNPKQGDTGADDGPEPSRAHFNGMHDLAITREGDIFLADTFTFRLRKIDGETREVATIAGSGVAGFSGDGGPAAQAKHSGVHACCLNAEETRLYITDLKNYRIRVIDLKTGIIETVAGNGEKGKPEDGAIATESPLAGPRAVTVDAEENVYIVSREGHALRVVGKDRRIRTLVNVSGKKGYRGDGSDARRALLNGPKHACVDGDGNVLIVDTENHVVRKYDPKSGIISLVAGVPGVKGDAIGSSPLETELNRPHGVRVDAEGRIYIADSENDRILRLE